MSESKEQEVELKNEESKPSSSREAFFGKIKEKYPDKDFENEDELYSTINGDYEDFGNKIGNYESESKKLVDLFSSDPRAADMLVKWKDGMNPIEYLLENFGDDFKEALEDPANKESFAEKHRIWLESQANGKKAEEEFETNLEETKSTLEVLQNEMGWDDEHAMKVFYFVNDIIMDGIKNTIKREVFIMADKALSYDQSVAEAEDIGEKKGKNAKIVAKLKEEENPSGMPPSLGGSNSSTTDELAKEKRNPLGRFKSGSFID